MLSGVTDEFSVVSWNVHMGVQDDRTRFDVVAGCRSFEADVVVLQEAWWWGVERSDLTKQVAHALGAECHEYVSPTPPSKYPAQFTVAILSRLPSRRLEDVPYPAMMGRERRLPRIQLAGSGLVIAGAHLDGIHSLQQRPWIWRHQRAMLRDFAPTVDVFAGDLNMWGPVVERELRPLRRAVRGRTWPAHRPHSQIDHILVSDRLEIVESEVLDDLGSDHRPVRTVLRPVSRAATAG